MFKTGGHFGLSCKNHEDSPEGMYVVDVRGRSERDMQRLAFGALFSLATLLKKSKKLYKVLKWRKICPLRMISGMYQWFFF